MRKMPVADLAEAAHDDTTILNAIPDPILLVDEGLRIRFVNPATEAFFGVGAPVLRRETLGDLVSFGSPLLSLVAQVQQTQSAVSEYAVDLGTPRTGVQSVNLQVAPVPEQPGAVVIRLEVNSIASKMDRQLTHRGAARSVVGMAAILAHEVKNPLSGIRGAAQLLEQSVDGGDRELTRLICDETDRICALVDRMEAFSDHRPAERSAVNIHQVLEHVRKVAEAGFASHVRFLEAYDPSLPPVHGNRDQLVQVFLNLVKNAAEAAPESGGEIRLSTAYRHGVRLAIPGSKDRVRLALEVSVADNGPGVPEDLRPYLFDPFVTTRAGGTGLGLALVAKIIGDHGGIVEADNARRGAVFRAHLPVFSGREES